MGWLEDRAHDHAERAMEHAYGVIGPGYGWAGGRFGRLLIGAIRWAGAALVLVLLGLWFKDGGTFSSKSTPVNSSHAEKPRGGF